MCNRNLFSMSVISFLIVGLCAFMVGPAMAQDSLLIGYQGRLTDNVGNPITGTPAVTFNIYDGAGISKWSEIHPAVSVNNGLFSVTLGAVTTMPDSVFNGDVRYLGIMVGADPEISPRTLFTSAPSAAYSKRMAGDLTTHPGVLILNNPSGDSAVTISSQTTAKGLVTTFKMIEPGDDGSPIMLMQADGGTNVFTHRIIEPADDDKPVYNFMADGPNQTVTWKLAHPPERPSAEIISNGIANTITFRLVHPPELPVISMSSDALSNQTVLLLQDPITAQSSISLNTGTETMGIVLEDRPSDATYGRRFHAGIESGEVALGLEGPNGSRLINIGGSPGIGGQANIYMFNPQPEPPASNPILTMSTGGDNSASIYMFNPQPEPPAKLLSLSANPTDGASISIFDEAGQVMGVEPTPFNSGFTIKLFNPQPEPPAVLAEMTSTYGLDGTSGRVAVYDPGAYLESELTPGNLRLQFNASATDGPALVLVADQTTARIGIGIDVPGFSLDMKSFGTGDGMRVNSSDGSQLFRVRENSDGSCETQISDLNGSTKVMIRANGATYFSGGNVGIGVTSPTNILQVQQGSATDPIADAWGVYSPKIGKDDIKPLESALARVEQLRGVSFNWPADNRHDIGMIAEEVGEVIPEAVIYDNNGIDARAIDYSRITAVLVEAIKELKQENDELKSRLKALEGR